MHSAFVFFPYARAMAARRLRTSPRRAPSQKRAADTVGILLDATELVLAERGFVATTTNMIADRAGVSIGSLYHYFPGKEALVEAVVHRMWTREVSALEGKNGLLLGDAPLEDVVRELVEAVVALVATQRAVYMRWYGEAPHLGQLEVGLGMANQAVSLVRTALERRAHAVRPQNLEFAADLAVKTVLAVTRTAARDYEKELASGELARELTTMLVRYLVK
jgi:AcrR family transcriptional regulator